MKTIAAESGEAWAVAILAAIATTFSNLGYGGKLIVGYAFKVGIMVLVSALVTGAMWFIAEGTTVAQTIFVPLGAELPLSSILDSPLLPQVRIVGGGAELSGIAFEDCFGKILFEAIL